MGFRTSITGAILAGWLCSGVAGCAHPALVAEKSLEAGSAAWDAHVDQVIAGCRAQELDTPDEREACLGDLVKQDAAVAAGVASAVAALRGYWLAKSAGASPRELAGLLEGVRRSMVELAPYFGGLAGGK